jgi:hypothetical protein
MADHGACMAANKACTVADDATADDDCDGGRWMRWRMMDDGAMTADNDTMAADDNVMADDAVVDDDADIDIDVGWGGQRASQTAVGWTTAIPLHTLHACAPTTYRLHLQRDCIIATSAVCRR